MIETFKKYNEQWKSGEVESPLVVLIGGHIGTGKSTFAKVLETYISPIYPLPTGVIRAIQQADSSRDDEPILFAHSYELQNLIDDESLTPGERTIQGFKAQAEVVQRAIINIINFSDTEGQQYIIEGNHILPSFAAEQINKKNIVSLFFKTSDIDRYAQMISGPTHRRELDEEQLQTVRNLHDFIVSEAESYGLPLFEFNQTNDALDYIAQELDQLIK